MSNILDWTLAALKKKADSAASNNNLTLAKLLDNCAEMYIDGLVLLAWEEGEPYIILTDKGISQIDKVNSLMGTQFKADDYIVTDRTKSESNIFFEEWEDE